MKKANLFFTVKAVLSSIFPLLIIGCDVKLKKQNDNKTVSNLIETDSIRDYESDTILVNYYANGRKESEGGLKNGQKNGYAKLYYENGGLKQKGLWKDDKQEGIWEFYYKNGSISAKIYFKNNKQDGLSIHYYNNGNVSEKANWENGNLNGEAEEFYYNGSIKRKTKWANGEKLSEQFFDSIPQ